MRALGAQITEAHNVTLGAQGVQAAPGLLERERHPVLLSRVHDAGA